MSLLVKETCKVYLSKELKRAKCSKSSKIELLELFLARAMSLHVLGWESLDIMRKKAKARMNVQNPKQ